jgi:hypothetical protein
MSNDRYGRSDFTRVALAPGLLGAIVVLAGLAAIGGGWFILIRYTVSILALILCVFAVQARAWWWLPPLIAIALLFNPVWPLAIDAAVFRLVHLGAGVCFVAAGIAIKVPAPATR